jgi:hypothetical protein
MTALTELSNTALIRQWWYTYCEILTGNGPTVTKDLIPLTDECERRGIVKAGLPMPRDGAEDLAKDCEYTRRRKGW